MERSLAIFNGAYIPLKGETAASGADMLSYGAAAFVKSVSSDILANLLDVYPVKDACTVMAIATLRIIHPSITAERMGTHYRRTFVCQHYPGVALSANAICNFLTSSSSRKPVSRVRRGHPNLSFRKISERKNGLNKIQAKWPQKR